jgi:hypothetical protein
MTPRPRPTETHEHFCEDCGDWWAHHDAECGEGGPDVNYDCPEHAGSQEVK